MTPVGFSIAHKLHCGRQCLQEQMAVLEEKLSQRDLQHEFMVDSAAKVCLCLFDAIYALHAKNKLGKCLCIEEQVQRSLPGVFFSWHMAIAQHCKAP